MLAMPRFMLSDEHWSKLQRILLHKTIYNKRNLRMTVEASTRNALGEVLHTWEAKRLCAPAGQ